MLRCGAQRDGEKDLTGSVVGLVYANVKDAHMCRK